MKNKRLRLVNSKIRDLLHFKIFMHMYESRDEMDRSIYHKIMYKTENTVGVRVELEVNRRLNSEIKNKFS